MSKSLKDVVYQYVKLNKPNNKGWHSCVHTGCDHGRKGPRAAFRFHDNGGIEFNCFNCPPDRRHTGFDPDRNTSFPKKLTQVFYDFGIPDQEWKEIQLNFFSDRKEEIKKEEKKIRSIDPKVISLPKDFVRIDEVLSTNKWAQVAYAYLESRKIDPSSHPFLISTNMKTKWAKRVIIPFYKKGNLISYTGRDLTGNAIKKYENPRIDNSKVIFNYDEIFNITENILFVVEGVIDALSIPNCVALLGNSITKEQIEWLERTRRRKVLIPDKTKGLDLADRFLNMGWSITTPEIGVCNDVNDAVVEYGSLYVLKSLHDKVIDGEMGKLAARLYCES